MSFKQLGEIATIKGGKRLPQGAALQTQPNSHPYIRVRDMGQKLIPRTGLEYVPYDVFPKISRYIVNTNDVIISIVGTIGLISIIDEYFDNASQTENCAKITGLDRVDAEYIYYYLVSCFGQEEIKKGTVGAVQAKLPLYSIEKIKVYWPERSIRQKIVNQLFVIDNKITLNRQINQTLEAMAQALFKSWFFDFEPVKAKLSALAVGGSADDANLAAMSAISGKTTEQLLTLKTTHPDQFQQLYTTADLFPSEMVDSELGEIPKGWEVKAFGDYLETISKTYPLKQVDEVVFLNTGDIQDGLFLHKNYVSSEGLPGQAKKSIQKHDILYSEIRPINRRFAYVSFDGEDYVVSTKLMVLRSKGKIPSEVLYFLLTRQNVIDELQIAAESRSGTFPQIRFENISKTEFVGPSDNALFVRFSDSYLKNYLSSHEEINSENKQLESLRDALLPKLLSGELLVDGVSE